MHTPHPAARRSARRAFVLPLLLLPAGIARSSPFAPLRELAAAEAEGCPAQAPPQERDLPSDPRTFRAPDLSQRVLFDEPGDGALWAVAGRNYKARFDSESATYFPRFGREVPRHYPLSFALAEVRIGEEEIEFARGVPYEREGSVVLFDRGSLVEFYELRSDSMEQKFLFESLPEAGDLVIRIAAETELGVFETPAGFELANEHGRAGYTRAVALDNLGRAGETTTSFAGGVIEIRVAARFLAEAAWPVTIDPLVYTFDVSVDATDHAVHPDVAYDSVNDRYGVVWEEAFTASDHDVFSLLLTSSGAIVPGSEVAIDFTSDCWTKPKVANNRATARFLTVCESSADCVTLTQIEGRSRSAGSNAMGNQFSIGNDFSGDKLNPDVGGDPLVSAPTYFCVVWQRILSPADHDIHYQLVKTDDTLFFPSTQVVDSSGGTVDAQPSISKSNGQRPASKQHWTVVWMRKLSANETDIRGAQIRWDGLLSQPPFPIDTTSSGIDVYPRVSSLLPTASAEREYMVVFQRGNFGNYDLMGRVMHGDTPLTPTMSLTAMEGPVSWDQSDEYPSVDADANTFAVLHAERFGTSSTDFDIQVGAFRYSAGTNKIVAEEVHVTMTNVLDREGWTRIVSHQSGTDGAPALPRRFAGVWLDEDVPGTEDGDILGGIYEALDAPGIALCFGDGSGTACPCGNAGDSGRGCANSTGLGARLRGVGSNVVTGPDLRLLAGQLPLNQPGLFFQGTLFVGAGAGAIFGDGLRCCGGTVVRLEVLNSGSAGSVVSTVDIASVGGVEPGDTRCYQFWYRDPNGDPCGSGFNLTNAYEVTWR